MLAEPLPGMSGLVIGAGVNLALDAERAADRTSTSLALAGAARRRPGRGARGLSRRSCPTLSATSRRPAATRSAARCATRCVAASHTIGRRVRVQLPAGDDPARHGGRDRRGRAADRRVGCGPHRGRRRRRDAPAVLMGVMSSTPDGTSALPAAAAGAGRSPGCARTRGALFWPSLVLIAARGAVGYFAGRVERGVGDRAALVGRGRRACCCSSCFRWRPGSAGGTRSPTRRLIIRHGFFVRVRQELLHSRGYDVTRDAAPGCRAASGRGDVLHQLRPRAPGRPQGRAARPTGAARAHRADGALADGGGACAGSSPSQSPTRPRSGDPASVDAVTRRTLASAATAARFAAGRGRTPTSGRARTGTRVPSTRPTTLVEMLSASTVLRAEQVVRH